jgi:hypothetical protein
MARCQFSIEFSGGAEELLQKAKDGITRARGSFEGDASQGAFRVPTPLGEIKGMYAIEGSVIAITVSDKPMLLGCGRIESELRKFMG